ncbi:MAG: PQQ-binding-like beta-propeller repeat protein [Planctomycetota bacterium]
MTFHLLQKSICPTLLLVLFFISTVGAVDDWPQWRGPNRNDQSNETGLLKSWPEGGPTQLWVNKDAGLGYAGFAVVGDRLFTMGLEDDNEFALCLNANTGEEVWRKDIGPRFKNGWGDGPRSTPTVDGEYVYFMSAVGNVACLTTADGTEKWTASMQDFGGKIPKWGYAESPLVDDGRVICTPGGPNTTIVALDKLTGKTVWKSEPIRGTMGDGKKTEPAIAHYSSVLPIEFNNRKQYVQLTVLAVVGLDAETGKTLWQNPFPGRVAVIPSPIFDDGDVYVTAGYGVGSKLISLEDDNQVDETWYTKAMQNHHGSVIKVGDFFYGSSAKAFVCQSEKDGQMMWSDRSIKKGALSYADGLFYHVQERGGEVLLFDATESGKVKVKGSFVLSPQTKRRNPRGMIWVHPVIANGKLYLRDQEFIHCYDIKE